MNNSNNSSSNSNEFSLPQHTMQRSDFVATLSEDIVLEIFAYLGQQDCLTTMAVSRLWYYSIPHFTQKIWAKVQVNPWDMSNRRLFHCLGDNVKYLILANFKHEQLYQMMDMLIKVGCTKVKTLELNECVTTAGQDDALSDRLKKLSGHVTDLKILRHTSNIILLNVLNVCPQLTHFMYQTGQDERDVHTSEVEDPKVHHFSTVTHVCLDAVLDRQLGLDPILRRCPNLRFFAGANLRRKIMFNNTPYNRIALNFDDLLRWCPKIAYIENTYGYSFIPTTEYVVDDDNKGLRHLSVCQTYQPATVARQVLDNQHTLEFLSIRRHGFDNDGIDWFSILHPVQLSQLRTLVLGKLGINCERIAAIIGNCPGLKKLVLYDTLTFRASAVRLINIHDQLQTLSLREVSIASDVSLMKFLSKFPSLEKLAMFHSSIPLMLQEEYRSPCNLKELDFRGMKWIHNNNAMVVENALIRLFQWFTTDTKLESVTLSDLPSFNIQSLSPIANMSTLKNLTVRINESMCTNIQEECLLELVMMLNNTVIEVLYMETWWHLPGTIVEKLKELPLLRVHHVSHRYSTLPCTHCSLPRKKMGG